MSDGSNAGSPIVPILDHVVINVMGNLDAAQAQFAKLGFDLTERGHHTLGSSNHLAIFDTNYLELLGYLPGRETMRADLWAHPPGLTGLVFKSVDADRVHATMQQRGVPVEPLASFARPVMLADGPRDARFRVIRVSGDEVQNGRTFFCHHDTPDMIWRPEWQSHPNGVIGIVEFVIASQQPARTAALYERMFGPGLLNAVPGGVSFAAGAATVSVLDPATIAADFEGAALTSPDGSDRMVALVFKVGSLAATKELFSAAAIPFAPFRKGGIVVPHAKAANVALGFVA